MKQTLVSAAQLAAHLQDPAWAILDCRADLANPQWGAQAYAQAHIPGALYASLEHDLSRAVTAQSGRHPLPPPEQFAATLGRWGIDAQVQVVAYDQGNSAFASRLWWMLRWLGHRAVAVLDGGFAAWQAAKLPLVAAVQSRAPRVFVSHADITPVVTSELEGLLARDAVALIDARAADRFAGRNETLDPVAGHVPGALNHPFTENLDASGHFRQPADLRERWERTLGGRAAEDVVMMCGSGVTACHNLLALEVAGLTGGRLYAGSWSEWIREGSHPVARDHS